MAETPWELDRECHPPRATSLLLYHLMLVPCLVTFCPVWAPCVCVCVHMCAVMPLLPKHLAPPVGNYPSPGTCVVYIGPCHPCHPLQRSSEVLRTGLMNNPESATAGPSLGSPWGQSGWGLPGCVVSVRQWQRERLRAGIAGLGWLWEVEVKGKGPWGQFQ